MPAAPGDAAGTTGAPPAAGTAGPRRAGFRADVQGLRGVAVLLVVVFLTGLALPGGSIGVDVFFVISGFVIARLLAGELAAGRRPSFAAFYARRARRLLPLLALTLVATAVAGRFLLSPLGPATTTARTAVAAALLNANTYLALQPQGYFDLAPTENALLHTWSLSVEEQFYVVFPALLVLAWRRWSKRGAVGVLAATAAGSFALALVLSPTWMFYAAPARAWEFLAGALLALWGATASRRVAPWLAAAGAAAVLVAAAGFDGTESFTAWHALVAVAGAAALVVAAPRALAVRPLVVLGDLSYAWYLLHWPLIVFAAARTDSAWAAPAAAVAALALSAVAHRLVEDPIRFATRIDGRWALVLAAVCLAVPSAVGAAVGRGDPGDALARSQELSATYDLGCHEVDPAFLPPACTFAVDDPRGDIALVGDSHAAVLAEPLVDAGNDLGFDVTATTRSACPFLDGLVLRRHVGTEAEAPNLRCADRVEQTFAWLQRLRPEVVVVQSADARYLARYDASVDGTTWITDPAGRAAAMEDALAETLDRLEDLGTDVLLVHDNPYPDLWPARCVSGDTDRCTSVVDADEVRADRQDAFDVEAAAADDAGVATFDPLPALCPDDACPNIVDSVWLYRDEHHLSVDGAALLEDGLREALAALSP